MKRTYLFIGAVILALGVGSATNLARAEGTVKTLSGSLSLDGEWDSNLYLDEKDEESAWLYGVSGGLSYSEEGQFSRITLDYGVRARQNSETSDAEVEHTLSVDYNRELARYLSIEVSDAFNTGYDTLNQGVRDQRLYKRRNRRRYYTNSAGLSADYTYGEGRGITLGYNNQYYDSSGNSTNEYMRHEFFASLEHKFTTHYGLVAGAQYEKGDFKENADTEGETVDIGLAYYPNPHDTLYLTYTYGNFTYRDERPDYNTHTLSVGWARKVTEKDQVRAFLGASYWENDQNDSDWAADYGFDYTRRLRRGSVHLSGQGGFRNMSYSSDNAGVSKFWMVDVSFNYDLMKRLALSASFNYRRDDFVQSINEHQEDRYLTRVGLGYTIRKWLSAGVSYSYNVLDSTLPGDDFTDHRVFIYIEAAKDLYRW